MLYINLPCFTGMYGHFLDWARSTELVLSIVMKRWYFFCCWIVFSTHVNILLQRWSPHCETVSGVFLQSKLEAVMSSCPKVGPGQRPRVLPKPINCKESFRYKKRFFNSLLLCLLTAASVVFTAPVVSVFTAAVPPFIIPPTFPVFRSLMGLTLVAGFPVKQEQAHEANFMNFGVGWITIGKDLWKPLVATVMHAICLSLPLILILVLLVIAGDVERNPGPGTKDPQSSDSEKLNNSCQFQLHGTVVEQQETTANASEGQRKGSQLELPSAHILVGNGKTTLIPFQSAGEEKSIQNNKSVTRSDASQSPTVTTVLSVQPSETKAPLDGMLVSHDQLQSDACILRSKSGTASILKLRHKGRSQSSIDYKKFIEELQIEVYDLVGLNPGKEPEKFYKLIGKANTLYRLGENCDICPLCLIEKKKRGGKVDSHVIPKSILKTFWELHGSKETDYIFDFSRAERLACRGLTYRLLCKKCDEGYSNYENHLNNMYKYIIGKPGKTFCFEGEARWLHFILATILFRGILTCVDLNGCANIFKTEQFLALWRYCKSFEESQCYPFPNTYLFLLPNKGFNVELSDFMYPFEMLLRMPRCTELIEQKEGTFFYCKFDIFHLVLPLCENSQQYFKTFKNSLSMESGTLKWSIQPKAQKHTKHTSFRSCQFLYPSDPEPAKELVDHFPEVLLRWCCSLYGKYIQRVFNQPQSELNKPPGHSFMYVERYRFSSYHTSYDETQYTGFKTDTRHNISSVLKDHASRTTQTTHGHEQLTVKIFNGTFDHSECLECAKSSSPLRDLKTKLKISEEKVEELRIDIGRKISELGATRGELGTTRDKLEMTEDELQKERLRRIQSDAALNKTHKGFMEWMYFRYQRLRSDTFTYHQYPNKLNAIKLREEISANIKELRQIVIIDPKLSSECESLLQGYIELENWLPHQENPRNTIVRQFSTS